MKKTILVAGLCAALLLSACTSGRTSESSASKGSAAAASNEEETTTVITPTLPKPQDIAYIRLFNSNGTDEPVATDFYFGNPEVAFDEGGSAKLLNYPAGQDIVITFKSDRKFDWGEIVRSESDTSKPHYIAQVKGKDKKYSSNIRQFLTNKDGVYTLTIPAKYVELGYVFSIRLSTKRWIDTNEQGDEISFQVRCEKS